MHIVILYTVTHLLIASVNLHMQMQGQKALESALVDAIAKLSSSAPTKEPVSTSFCEQSSFVDNLWLLPVLILSVVVIFYFSNNASTLNFLKGAETASFQSVVDSNNLILEKISRLESAVSKNNSMLNSLSQGQFTKRDSEHVSSFVAELLEGFD